LYRVFSAKGADKKENSVDKSRELSVIKFSEQIIAPHKIERSKHAACGKKRR
jgi:hypothetical protein